MFGVCVCGGGRSSIKLGKLCRYQISLYHCKCETKDMFSIKFVLEGKNRLAISDDYKVWCQIEGGKCERVSIRTYLSLDIRNSYLPLIPKSCFFAVMKMKILKNYLYLNYHHISLIAKKKTIF